MQSSHKPEQHTPGGRDFEFNDRDFRRVCELIHQRAGIALAPAKRDMVYGRLSRRLRALGMQTFQEYLDKLERDGGDEWQAFTNALTTNLTSFFREPHHFPILAEHLKKLQTQGRSQIKIWCSAASTGEEPYSIAMTVVEAFNSFNVPVSIFASDLDTNVLAFGMKGVYPRDRVDKLSPERLSRFFTKGAAGPGESYTVKPELRRLITFQRINLLEPNWSVRGPLDVLFCRNVMIYFDKPTQHKILTRFAPLMSHDGLLFAGHSESFLHAADVFHSKGKTVYELARKRD